MTTFDAITEAQEAVATLAREPSAQPVLSWGAADYLRQLPTEQRTAWAKAYRAELARQGHSDATILTPLGAVIT